MSRDFIITGIPRSGTSFVCALLNHLSDVVALNETMDINTLLSAPDASARTAVLRAYFASTRNSISKTGRMPQHELAGSDNNMFLSETVVGRKSAKTGRLISVDAHENLSSNFALGLKNLNVFALLLSELNVHFDCCALVRNPLATLASWHTLDHPVRDGQIVAAKRINIPLADRLADIGNSRDRRLALLAWYYERFTEVLKADRIFRYEDIISSNGRNLETMFPSASKLPHLQTEPLQNHNESRLYGAATEAIGDAETLLEDQSHACWRIYAPSEVRALIRSYKTRAQEPVSACRQLRIENTQCSSGGTDHVTLNSQLESK